MAKYAISDKGPTSIRCSVTGWEIVKGGPARRLPAGASPQLAQYVRDGVLVKQAVGDAVEAVDAGNIRDGALDAVRAIVAEANPDKLTKAGSPKVPDIEQALIDAGHDAAVARSFVTPELRDELYEIVEAEKAQDAETVE